MADEAPSVAIERLRSTWVRETRPSGRRAMVALWCAVLAGSAHVARVGSPAARSAAAGALGATVVLTAARSLYLWRRRVNQRHILRDTLGRMDPELGDATLRALSLVERTTQSDDAGSPALASLHLSRVLGRASLDGVAAQASRTAARWAGVGTVLAAGAAGAVVFEPFRVVEGFDVLAAKAGDAPLPLPWIDGVTVVAAPPEYLRQASTAIPPFSSGFLPRGTVLTVRGRPVHAGRPLVLTDGRSEVDFADGGSGELVARWELGASTAVWVAARFGSVRIRQTDQQRIESIPDEAPKVTVEGAPRTVSLLDEPSIPIHYEATDDHGLREVDLVLRTGTREPERRVLSRPVADTRADRGGYEVQARDPFFKKTYAPVEITVEARDNDSISGPKWGKSAAIVVLPPAVGEAEARRYQALVAARNALIDLAAFRVTERAGGKSHIAQEVEAQATAVTAVQTAIAGTYGGLRVRGRLVTLARGQLRRLDRALAAEKKKPVAAEHDHVVAETESTLLAFDSGLRGLGARDTQDVAKRIADVADDAATALAAMTSGADAATSMARAGVSIGVIAGGGKQLLKLGDLGLDLGEIVANDLRRVDRAKAASDWKHAELAMRDLAARLRRPNPSFSGGGGGQGHGTGQGGVESGGVPGGEGGQSSGADEESAAMGHELEELSEDHRAKISDVEGALEKAVLPEEVDALRQEARQHAEAIREAVKKIAPQRGKVGPAQAAAAAGREEAEAMAGALEGGRPKEAVESGKRAAEKLQEAKRVGDASSMGLVQEDRAGREAAAAEPTLRRELAWAEEALEKLRRAAAQRAKGDLAREGAAEHNLAERAKDLLKKGSGGERSMPQEMQDRLADAEKAMRDAQKALEAGDGEAGLHLQGEAQRMLEMSVPDREESEGAGSKSGNGKLPTGKAEIPGKGQHKGLRDFRERVLRGLSAPGDTLLKDAVKRYAEGLLK